MIIAGVYTRPIYKKCEFAITSAERGIMATNTKKKQTAAAVINRTNKGNNKNTSTSSKKAPRTTQKGKGAQSNITKKTSKKSKNKSFWDKTQEEFVSLGYKVFVAYIVILAFRYLYAFTWLTDTVITNNMLLILICIAAPAGLWVYSTRFDRWNFHKPKRMWLYLVIISAIASIEQILFYYVHKYIIVRILQIPITENVTKSMVVTLARIVLFLIMLIGSALFIIPIKQYLLDDNVKEKINSFRISHHVDFRENKENLYDLHIIKDLETGKDSIIQENDRFVHSFINGQSGTGKTSSTIIPGVVEDLNTKVANREKREELLLKMLKQKKCYIKGPLAKVEEYDIKPKEKYRAEFEAIYKKYPDCGMTIMAPNDDMAKTIIKACEVRKVAVNEVNPVRKTEGKYVTRKGIHNFYIPLDLSEEEKAIRISEQATTFSEVIIAANESSGQGEQYFRDLNTSVTTNIAMVCMLAANIERRQTNIIEVQNCINKFAELAPLVKIIEDYYEIKIEADATKAVSAETALENLNKNASKGQKKGTGKDSPYYPTILDVKNDLLGPGADDMRKQARGLKNTINKILRDMRYRDLFSQSPENSLNFDEMLSRNQVTVVNTGLEVGPEPSTMLGLIFLLNFQTAIQRRPNDITRSNHFMWIDEASQYMHRAYENMFALYRQYRVATTLAMQSISQMDKNKSTAYLKNIILGCGIQIVFGRVSAEEMKLYQDIAGVVFEESVQKTRTRTSLISKNPNLTAAERITNEKKNNVEGSKIRMRDFQEVTVFKIKQGRVEPGFLGKCNFLDKKELKPREIVRVNFAKYVTNGEVKKEIFLSNPAKDFITEQREFINQNTEKTIIHQKDTISDAKATPITEAINITETEQVVKLRESFEKEQKELFVESYDPADIEEIKKKQEKNEEINTDSIRFAEEKSISQLKQEEISRTEHIAESAKEVKKLDEFEKSLFGNLFADDVEEEDYVQSLTDDLGEV